MSELKSIMLLRCDVCQKAKPFLFRVKGIITGEDRWICPHCHEIIKAGQFLEHKHLD